VHPPLAHGLGTLAGALALLGIALAPLAGSGCAKPAEPAAPAPAAEPPEPPMKKDCAYCVMATHRGERRCMDVQDGPCGNERVGSCMHVNAYCAAACCADAGG